MGRAAANRRIGLNKALAGASEEEREAEAQSLTASIVNKMRQFFGVTKQN